MRIRLKQRVLAELVARSRQSQNAWALKLGLDSGHFSKLVNGKRPYPGAKTRQKLLEGCGLPFEALFEIEHRLHRKQKIGSQSLKAGLEPAPSIGGSIVGFIQDLRYAARMMWKSPGFTAVACLIIALGVGSNTTIFSVVNGVLWNPLPFDEPDDITFVWSSDNDTGKTNSVAYPTFLDWQEQSRSFDHLAAFAQENFVLTGRGAAQRFVGEMTSAEYFPLLGVSTWRGRTFTPAENRLGGASAVAVVGYGMWQRQFGEDPDLIGQTVELNGHPYVVIGIMPPGFKGFTGRADLWAPIGMFDVINPALARYDVLNSRAPRWHNVIGRLRSEATFEQAQSEMDAIAEATAKAYPKHEAIRGVRLVSAYEQIVGKFETSLFVLCGAVGFVLLVACTNVANLFLSRMAARTREVAVRASLGATRGRLVRQLLTESLLFGVIGGALGLLLAHWSLKPLVALAPVRFPEFVDVAIDSRVLLFTLLITLVTSVFFGLFPALGSTHFRPIEFLKEAARSPGLSLGRGSVRGALVVVEVSLALLLLIGAGLMAKSFRKMVLFEPGFESERLLTLKFDIVEQSDSGKSAASLMGRLAESVEALPGVESAALTSHIFYGPGYMTTAVTIEGYTPPDPNQDILSYAQFVGPGFFKTMGTPILHGREFDERDDANSPSVCIVNESFARKFWPDQNPIGRRLVMGRHEPGEEWVTVVGVAEDVQPYIRRDSTELHQVYYPVEHGGQWSRGLVLRTEADPLSVVGPLRATVKELSPNIPIFSVASMDELLAGSRSQTQFIAFLMGGFAFMALVLAAVGIYGVVSYAVSQLTHEVGIRMALGARGRDVMTFIMGRAVVLIAVGLTLGVLGSLAVTRLIGTLLYDVSPFDMGTYVVLSLLLAVTVLLASYIPARRAARLDPLVALRYE